MSHVHQEPALSLYDVESFDDCTLDAISSHLCRFDDFRFVRLLYARYLEVLERASIAVADPSGGGQLAFPPVPLAPSSSAAITGVAFALPPGESQKLSADVLAIRFALAKTLGFALDDPEDNDLAPSALVDVYLDLLHFAVVHSMTDLQTQQLLLLFEETHTDIAWMQKVEDMANVVERLIARIARLTCHRPCAIVETRNVEEVVIQETVDPLALQLAEASLAKQKGKKDKKVDLASLPKIQVRNVIRHDVKEEKESQIDAYFSAADAQAIVAFVRQTLLQHWRLYAFCATQPRVTDSTEIHLVHEDPLAVLPATSSAISEGQFLAAQARQAVVADYQAVAEAEFAELVHALDKSYASFIAEDSVTREKFLREVAEDKWNAMTPQEFTRTLQVLKNLAENASPTKEAGGASFFTEMEGRIRQAEAQLKAREPPEKPDPRKPQRK